MKLLTFPAFAGGCLAAAIVNPFDPLICFQPSRKPIPVTATTPATQSSTSSAKSWVTTDNGLVTSYYYNDASSTAWVFPTGSGTHEATKVIYEGVQVISVSFVVIVVDVINSQTTTVISLDSSSTHTASSTAASTSASRTSSSPTTTTKPKATHLVEVGTSGGFAYRPNQLNASIGDTVRFNFLGRNHSVTQSDLASPCTYNGGFDTGLNQFNPLNVSGKFLIDFQVNVSTPLWFYCQQPGPPSHCGGGMIFAINPRDRFDQFSKNAKAQGQALTILSSILGTIGNASSFSVSAADNALFNSTSRRRYLR